MAENGPSGEKKITKLDLLESAPHFHYLTFEDKKKLVPYMTAQKFLPGDFIITEGEEMNVTYFILSGKAEVLKSNAEGDRRKLAIIGKGEFVGEAAIVPQESPSSTVLIRAVENVIVLGLPGARFEEMMINAPDLAFKIVFDILRLLRQRLNEVSNRLADSMDKD